MAPTNEELNRIAKQAEVDLNSYQAKQGLNNSSVDDAGVDTGVENKFPGAEVKYGSELSTNASYNKRIPPEEGGELDDRGRQTRGTHFEGTGGPESKFEETGENDNDVVTSKALGRSDVVGAGKERKGNDILDRGVSATTNNVGSNPPGPGGSKFKGEDYYRPESVPDSVSAEGYLAPESVTQASKETELGS
ncbi:hypothetical protein M406DRAFT_335433 [Cryphonectria parasitica EP155]|uniref:Uncharacterized protein n=1 Tax=Cryphonectria parasitica (strain ATCC 38755 / EP155) TaxID=660469 RepID=A0A9P4YA36_CRYP1|nr:uncharacterized protein M406DRAFT_335433 [Cryphonectria parasitica EP155]KAF3769576.1 hypothetical protein M406DRAFT_335433 [Cryphonectria parasitica EP155]